jgi:hypothetical protein
MESESMSLLSIFSLNKSIHSIMPQHVLSLEAPDTLNKCILRVVDTSIYNPQSTPKCPLLQITLPGFNTPVQFTDAEIAPGFSLNLTACDLGLQTANCGSMFTDLADGIYIIRYSVSPNDLVYVEYNHLRITCALNKVQGVYCDLDLAACEPPETLKQKLNQIRLIQQYLNAAKAQVEFCHQPKKGMELYRYAIRLLDKLTCTTCTTC